MIRNVKVLTYLFKIKNIGIVVTNDRHCAADWDSCLLTMKDLKNTAGLQ